jgi:hypothetical protein
MTDKRTFALLGFVLGLLSAILIVVAALRLGRGEQVDLDLVVERIVEIVLGVVILFGSLLIYRGTTNAGGFVNLLVGIVALFFVGTTESVLAIISGILGLIAAGTLR